MQSDPIGLAGGFDTYAYVGNNPMGAVDSLGLRTINMGLDATNLAYSLEATVKSRDNDDGYLRILGHGTITSLANLNAYELGSLIVGGKFVYRNDDRTLGFAGNDDYFQRKAAKNEDINIILDACDVGARFLGGVDGPDGKPIQKPFASFAEDLFNYLNAHLKSIGSTSKLTVRAPNGKIRWWLGLNIIDNPRYYQDEVGDKRNGNVGGWREITN